MKISKKTEYGLKAMVFLAKNPIRKAAKGAPQSPFSLREIAAKTKISFGFLERIFSKLEKAGLVKAKLGVRGGYFLAKPAKKISVADIVVVLEEDLEVVHCQGCPMAGGCSSASMWQEVEQSINKTMGKKTLADLIK